MNRRNVILGSVAALLGLCCLLAAAVALGYYFLWPRSECTVVLDWSTREEEFVKRAAFALMACLAWHN